jgi:hypothetical protein
MLNEWGLGAPPPRTANFEVLDLAMNGKSYRWIRENYYTQFNAPFRSYKYRYREAVFAADRAALKVYFLPQGGVTAQTGYRPRFKAYCASETCGYEVRTFAYLERLTAHDAKGKDAVSYRSEFFDWKERDVWREITGEEYERLAGSGVRVDLMELQQRCGEPPPGSVPPDPFFSYARPNPVQDFLLDAIHEEHDDLARYYLERDHASPNSTPIPGETPLVHAVDLGRDSLVHLFLDAGADPNVALRGWSPLRRAIGQADVAMALLKHGADPNEPDSEGKLPVEFVSCADRELLEALRAAGADTSRCRPP